jgi:hypothetical protein
MTKETITISKEEHTQLLEDSHFLQCLQDAGVDNWDGYDFAQEMYDSEKDLEDAEEN